MINTQNSSKWQITEYGVLNKNRLIRKKDLEEYKSSLEGINFDLQENNAIDLVTRAVKAVTAACYCLNKSDAINDERYPLIKDIFEILNNVKDNDISSFCGNVQSFIKAIESNKLPDLYWCNQVNSSAIKFLQNHKNGKSYPHSFLNDYNRIVFSSAFRRLQDKAQVFSLEEHDYVRTRLTHTIEVSSIASQLGNLCALRLFPNQGNTKKNMAFQMDKILAAAALLHDVGNPPFGHYGEDIIKSFFIKNWDSFEFTVYDKNNNALPSRKKISGMIKQGDFTKYDGNAQSLRIASTLQVYKPGHSLELTAAVLGAIIKYPINSEDSSDDKMGFFYSERKVIEDLQALGVFKYKVRNPLVFLLEAADDICYVTSDLDDVVKKHIVDYEDFIFELEQIDEKDVVLAQFKKDFEKYYQENRKLAIDSPFELTIRRMANDLKLRLIDEVVETYCDAKIHDKIIDGVDIFSASNNNQFKSKIDLKETHELLNLVPSASLINWLRTKIFGKYVYPCKSIIIDETVGHEILNYILAVMCDAVLHLNFNRDENDNFVLLPKKDKKLYKQYEKTFRLISRNFVEQFKEDTASLKPDEPEHIYYRFRLVVDYISGMTDSYAKEVYQILKGIK